MRLFLIFAGLLAALSSACGSDSPADTPTPADAVAPTSAPTAGSMVSSTSTPAPTAAGTPAPEAAETQAVGAGALGRPKEGGVLKLLGADPPTLDPHRAGDVTSSRYVLEVFGGLLTLDPDLAVAPDLAEDWAIDPDGMGYTFRLNPAATFQDGRKVTADDVRWSLERAANPDTQSPTAAIFLGDIVGVPEKLNREAAAISGVGSLDEGTLRVETDAPKPYFLSKLTYPSAFVVDRSNVESGRGWVQSPNGTGPFILAEYEPGTLMRLERFDGYHLGPAVLDAVEFNLAGGNGLLMYENDEIHLGVIGPAALEGLRDPANPLHNQIHQGPPEFMVNYIGMNSQEPPFDDVKVRLALNYAIDRETLAQILLEETVRPAKGILPPGFPGYNSELTGYEYNPEKARQLLAESRYGSDAASYPLITMTLPGSFGSPVSPTMGAILATWEEQLGIRIELLQTEWATYLEDLRQYRFQIFGGLGWIADYPDPENFLDGLFHTQSSNNHTRYSDPKLDALLERARVELDQTARFALYQQAERMILEGAPWVPLWHSTGEIYLIKPYVKGFPLSPLVIPRLRFVYFIE